MRINKDIEFWSDTGAMNKTTTIWLLTGIVLGVVSDIYFITKFF